MVEIGGTEIGNNPSFKKITIHGEGVSPRPVESPLGQLGSVVEVPFTTEPGDRIARVTCKIATSPENVDAITSGAHMWPTPESTPLSDVLRPQTGYKLELQRSRAVRTQQQPELSIGDQAKLHIARGVRHISKEARKKADRGSFENVSPIPLNVTIGIQPEGRSPGESQHPFFEPGFVEADGNVDGRSYGFVGFHNRDTGEDFVIGVLPEREAFTRLTWEKTADGIDVNIEEDLEGIPPAGSTQMRIFTGAVQAEKEGMKYADLLRAYGKELAKIDHSVPLMSDRVIGFSWPVFGHDVTQSDIESEIAALKDTPVDTYIIDAGWESPEDPFAVNKERFHDLPDVVKGMKAQGVKLGLWFAPFQLQPAAAASVSPEWLIQNEHGEPLRVPFPFKNEKNNPFALDISQPQVQEYIIARMQEYVAMGFEVFKLDFLSSALVGEMKHHEQTKVGYYRDFMKNLRRSLDDVAGGPGKIELIGSGAPMLESLGLFNGLRFTWDTLTPDSELPPHVGNLIAKPINTYLYRRGIATASRRMLPFGEAYGLVFDGVHMADGQAKLDPDVRDGINEGLLKVASLGARANLFVGDSFAQMSTEEREKWMDYIQRFKQRAQR